MAPSLLARLGTRSGRDCCQAAKAPSNGRIQSRVPAKNLPKRLGPLLGSVTITITIYGEHKTSPPSAPTA